MAVADKSCEQAQLQFQAGNRSAVHPSMQAHEVFLPCVPRLNGLHSV